MINGLLIIEILIYSVVLWLGLYLVGRNPAKPRLWFAGLGLVAYALSLGAGLLVEYAPTPEISLSLARLQWPMVFLPAMFGLGAMAHLLPDTTPLKPYLNRILSYAILPAAVLFYLLSAGANFIFDFSVVPPQAGPAYLISAGIVLLLLLTALFLVVQTFRSTQSQKPRALILLTAFFFVLSAGPLLLPLNLLPRLWLLVAVSLDFIFLGMVIALLDALEEGETLLYDFIHSLDFSAGGVLLFGGLVGLTMALSTGVTLAMLTLLLAIITLTILAQTFWVQTQDLFDTITFKAFPALRLERANLRAIADALPRANAAIKPTTLDEDEFTRLTRHAISYMGNLPRLATSPLIRLPIIDTRLAQRRATDNTLERAAELKSLLTESIIRLKPRDKGDFGPTEEWRHYNALYFPYVAGLKPYNRRAEQDHLVPATQKALAWFHTYVPERTLYNWQNAAARLVAKDLREGLNDR